MSPASPTGPSAPFAAGAVKLELAALTFTFLDDFVHSDRTPEYCVRNFSDACRGKVEELSDIENNRARYLISYGTFLMRSVDFNTPGNTPEGATFATVYAPCRFVSTVRATGETEVADGTCRLRNVHEQGRWRLCESNFLPPEGAPIGKFTF